jgi:GNAT superfamily N-acetyltransferase
MVIASIATIAPHSLHRDETDPMAASVLERRHGPYVISTARSRLDLALIHGYLANESYWAEGRERATSDRAIEHSHLVVGAYDSENAQVAFARMVTDLATWAWLCDVFVLPDHQGGGLGAALVGALVGHPDVVDISRQFLATADAHGLYAKFGFTALDDPTRWMHRPGPDRRLPSEAVPDSRLPTNREPTNREP